MLTTIMVPIAIPVVKTERGWASSNRQGQDNSEYQLPRATHSSIEGRNWIAIADCRLMVL
ncbi:MAG TPA: hypothetical protein VJQ82_13710 [Terriglobales bacterium]|nr:hypothetical protein [Terriglobales bacterium]